MRLIETWRHLSMYTYLTLALLLDVRQASWQASPVRGLGRLVVMRMYILQAYARIVGIKKRCFY